MERIYNISFSKIYSIGRHRERARKAIKFVRSFAARHMKTQEERVVLGMDVNELVWRNGMQRPPKKLRVKMLKDKEGTVMVSLESPAKQASEKKEATPKKAKAEKPKKEAEPKKEKAAEAKPAPVEQKA